jgi:hypothetical protein
MFQNEGKIPYYKYNKSYNSLIAPETTDFSDEQLKLMETITIDMCSNFVAQTISELTHNSYVWQLAEMEDELPLVYYFDPPVKMTPEEIEKAKQWTEKIGMPDTLDYLND